MTATKLLAIKIANEAEQPNKSYNFNGNQNNHSFNIKCQNKWIGVRIVHCACNMILKIEKD